MNHFPEQVVAKLSRRIKETAEGLGFELVGI
jgi:hypothetical protein